MTSAGPVDFVLDLPSEAHTLALAAAVARFALPGMEIHLCGDLAAGKTAFARGFLQQLGHRGTVKSPTFTLVETYDLGPAGAIRRVHHFDLYRLADPAELHMLGFEDYQEEGALCLVEWPSRGGRYLSPSMSIDLTVTGLESRRAQVSLDTAETRLRHQELGRLLANLC